MSSIDLYPNDLRMPQAKETYDYSTIVPPALSDVNPNIYVSLNGLINRPYHFYIKHEIEEYFCNLNVSSTDLFNYCKMDCYHIDNQNYCCIKLFSSMVYSESFSNSYPDYGYFLPTIINVLNPENVTPNEVTSMSDEFDLITEAGLYMDYYGYCTLSFCTHVSASFTNIRSGEKSLTLEIDIGSVIDKSENVISFDDIFEKLKPKFLESYSSLFQGDINTYSSTLFDFYSNSDPNFSNLISNPRPNINKQKLFYEADIVDIPFFTYSAQIASGKDQTIEFNKLRYLEYSSFAYNKRSKRTSFSDYVSTIYYNGINTYYGNPLAECSYCVIDEPNYSNSALYSISPSGLHITPSGVGKYKIKIGTIGSQYYPDTRANSARELDLDVIIRFSSIVDFEPEVKSYSFDVYETKKVDFKDYYTEKASGLNIISDNSELIVKSLGDGVFEFTSNKSGTYTASQYVNGKLKPNKISITVNCDFVEINLNTTTNSYYKFDISDYTNVPPSYINFEYDNYKVNFESIDEGIYFIKALISDTIRIKYYINDKDFKYIIITSSENTNEIHGGKFITISKNQNRRIVSNFDEFKKYSTIVSSDKAYMIMDWDDFKFKNVLKSIKSKSFSNTATLIVENNKIEFKYGSESIYRSSVGENGKTIFIKITNSANSDILYDKVILFDKKLTNDYINQKELDLIKSNYRTVELLNFDDKAVYSDSIVSESVTNVDIEMFYLENSEKVQMWEIDSPISGNMYAFNNKEDFSINSIQDSINKLGCTLYKENGVFGLYVNDNSLINTVEIELDDDVINPFILEDLKNNGKRVIIANSENHKSVYKQIVDKNKKYSLTDLRKPSNLKIFTYDKDDKKVGEFSIVSNGLGDYRIKDSFFASKDDIEDVDLSFCIEGNSINSKTYECFENVIKCRMDKTYKLILYKNFKDANPNVTLSINTINISKIEETDNQIVYEISPKGTNDTTDVIEITDGRYSDTISVEFKNIVYKHKPTNKSELQTLLFNTSPTPKLEEIDTSLITDMSSLFNGRSSYTFNGIEYWDVSNVADMSNMFSNCANAFNHNINNWNVSNVTNMYNMFYNCNFFDYPLYNWNVSNVTNMSYMFYNCYNFNQPLNNWNVSNVTNMAYMFYNCYDFNQPLSNWNVSSVGSMSQMFYNCYNFNQDISNWPIYSKVNLTSFLYNCYNFDQDMSNFNLLDNNYTSNMFYNTKIEDTYKSRSKYFKLREQIFANKGNLQNVDVSGHTNLCNLFNDSRFNGWTNQDFNGIEYWNVSNVTNMSNMFYNCYDFNQPLNKWDVSNVLDMSNMFCGCTSFNQDINNWNVTNVINMDKMFYGCRNFDQPLNNWNVTNVINMGEMFYSCTSFNQDISSWNVTNVTNMSYMFASCVKFNKPLNNWNVSNVTSMGYMFYNCYNFNQPLSNWNVSNVINMVNMFYNCTSFNQDISSWNVTNVTNYTGIFSGCNISTNNKPPRFM